MHHWSLHVIGALSISRSIRQWNVSIKLSLRRPLVKKNWSSDTSQSYRWRNACDVNSKWRHKRMDAEPDTGIDRSMSWPHGRWNRGSRGSSCSPKFWHGRAGHSSCSPKSLSLLHCDVRPSRIDLDILEFCRSVGRSRTKKLSASGGLRPPDPPPGALPWTPLGAPPPDPRYRLALHALAVAPATACSPNFRTLPTPMRLHVFWYADCRTAEWLCCSSDYTV